MRPSVPSLRVSRSLFRFVDRLPSRGAGLLDCWTFPTTHRDGYARFGGRVVWPELYAHRLVAMWLWGPIPDGFEVDHLCNVRNCVNPLHLHVCTLAENRQKRGARRSHCPKGHPYAGANLYVNPRTGARACRKCTRAATRRWAARARLDAPDSR